MEITGYQIIGARSKWRMRYEMLVVQLEDATTDALEITTDLVNASNKLAKLKDLEDKYNTSVISQEGYTISEALKRKKMFNDISYQLRGYHSARTTMVTDRNRQKAYMNIRSAIVTLEEFLAMARSTPVIIDFDEDLLR